MTIYFKQSKHKPQVQTLTWHLIVSPFQIGWALFAIYYWEF